MISEKKIFFLIISLWKLYIGMAVILIYGLWPFLQIFNPPLIQGSIWSLNKFGPGVSEKKSSKMWTDGQTYDG